MKPSLLIRFRWPLFVGLFSASHVAGIAYLYGDSETAMYAFVCCMFFCTAAVVLNTIDETTQDFE